MHHGIGNMVGYHPPPPPGHQTCAPTLLPPPQDIRPLPPSDIGPEHLPPSLLLTSGGHHWRPA